MQLSDSLALAAVLMACQLQATLADDEPPHTGVATGTVQAGGGGGGIAVNAGGSNGGAVVVRTGDPLAEGELPPPPHYTRPWLGLGVEEVSEALGSQLNLAPGVGLVVIYVTPDSPAAKAGLEKNDVLVEFEGQSLVVTAQLRKLVQVHKVGDKVELVFYHAGKKQTASATLGKAPPGYGLLEDGEVLKGDLAGLRREFQTWPMGDAWRDAMNVYRDQMGHFKLDQGKVHEEVLRSLDQAKRAWQEVLRDSTNAASAAVAGALKELQRSGIMPDNTASVTVRSSGDKVRSIVKADDSGTIIIVSNPKPHLTAHDKNGKLLFDGEIDTPEQRAKVPPEVWKKAEPMLDKLAPKAEEEPGTKPAHAKGDAADDADVPSSNPAVPTL